MKPTLNETEQQELKRLREDAKRLDWIEKQAKKSSTGISFDWCRYVEDGQVLEKGFRFMRHHFLGERAESIRDCIDLCMNPPVE